MKDTETVTLDSPLWEVYGAGAKSMEDGGGTDQEVNEGKPAIIKLFEQAVESAKPKKRNTTSPASWNAGFNQAIDEYEQNLKQALSNSEVNPNE